MKSQFLISSLLLTLLFSLLANTQPSFAQAGTQKWRFQNREQVRSAVLGNLDDLRTSYEVVTCAARQGMIRTALKTYEEVIGKDIYDASPEVCSSYALAHHYFADPYPWNWKQDTDNSIRTVGKNGGLQVQWFRERALRAKPNSPEVVLSYALWSADQKDGRPLALQQINKVVRLAPNWADAHYWRADIISMRWSVMPSEERKAAAKHYGKTQLLALDKAQKLDSAFKTEGLLRRFYAHQTMGNYKAALIAFDAYLASNKGFASALDGQHGGGSYAKWRQYLVSKAQNS